MDIRIPLACLPLLMNTAPSAAQWAWTQALQSSTTTGYEWGEACAIAPDGSFVVAGLWRDSVRFGDIAFADTDDPGVVHGFVLCYDASGTPLWAHDIATTDESPIAHVDVDVDTEGNIIVGGDARSPVLLDGVPAAGADGAADRREYFVMRFAADGSYIWGRHLQVDAFTGEFNALDVDGNGDIWAVGHDGIQKGHLFKLNGSTGTELVHHTTQGASSYVNDVKTDAANNAYIIGYALNDFTITGVVCPHNHDLGPSTSQWIGKFDANGVAQWFHVPSQGGQGFAPYPEGNLAVTPDGTVFSDSRKLIRFGDDTISTGSPGLRGIYALDTDGNLLFARRANTTSGLYFTEAIGTADGQAIFVGHYNGIANVDLVDTAATVQPGGNTLVLIRYDADGRTTGLKVGPHITEAYGLDLDDEGRPAICGVFSLAIRFDGLTLDGDWDLFALRSGPLHTGWIEASADVDPQPWPNPASSIVNLPMRPGGSAFSVIDALGREHAVPIGARTSTGITLDVAGLPAGTYAVRWTDGQRPLSARVLVLH